MTRQSRLNPVVNAGDLPWVSVGIFGAVPNAREITISVTSGQASFTSPEALSSWVGKTICVRGAGVGGANLVTTITSAVSGASATLTTTPSTTAASTTAVVGTDSTAAFQTALNALQPGGVLEIPAPLREGEGDSYLITDTLATTTPNITLRGSGATFGANGSRILFAPLTGRPLLVHGTDSGNAYDSNEYDGPAGLKLTDLNIRASLTGTALANTTTPGKYAAGSVGIKDWRGGDKVFDRCTFTGFETAVWSIQADFDTWNQCTIYQCHRGIYHGPRSDQMTWNGGYIASCDLALDLDGCHQARFFGTSFVNNGTPTTSAISIHSAGWFRASDGHLFQGCWYEQYLGDLVESFFSVGITSGAADTQISRDLKINDSFILMGTYGSGHNVRCMVKANAADRISIRGVSRDDVLNLAVWFKFVGSNNVTTLLDVHSKFDRNLNPSAPLTRDESGSTATANKVNVVSWGNTARNGIAINDITITGGLTRTPVAVAISASTYAMNMGTWGAYRLTLNADVTLSMTNIVDGGMYSIAVKQGASGGPYIVTWPAAVKWADGIAPTLSTTAGTYDVFTFIGDAAGNLVEAARSLGGLTTTLAAKQPKFLTGTCSTAAGTAAKTVTLDSPWASTTPAAGDWLAIKFTNGNSGSSPTLAVNGGSAYGIRTPSGDTNVANTYMSPNMVVLLTFDGTYWRLQGTTGNTTYNKVSSTASASSLTPDCSGSDVWVYTALATNLTINAPTNPSNAFRARFRFKDDGTSRTLTWNAIFRAAGVTIPTATVAGKWHYIEAEYNLADTKWDVISVLQQA